MPDQDPRDHGYGTSPKVIGKPRVTSTKPTGSACPHCGCTTLFGIEVELEDSLDMISMTPLSALLGGDGTVKVRGIYVHLRRVSCVPLGLGNGRRCHTAG